MTKAKEAALKAYPDKEMNGIALLFGEHRRLFQEGYEQAEKDLAFAPDNKRPKTWSKRAKEALKPYFGNSESKLAEIFVAGYMQAEEDLGWISVKDGLPDTTEYVFTCVKMNGIPQCVGFHYYKDGKWWEGYGEDADVEVEYWMPIPKFKEAKK